MKLADVQNPFDPSGWVGRIEVVRLPTVGVDNTLSEPICPPDPMRVWLLLTSTHPTDRWWVWPEQQSGLYGITPITIPGSVLIHNASYPGAVQSQWYGIGELAGQDIVVIAGRAITNVE